MRESGGCYVKMFTANYRTFHQGSVDRLLPGHTLRTYLLPGPVLLLLACAALGLSAFAQRNTGSIVGLITDSNGAVIANAAITVTNIETGTIRTEVSTKTGDYRVVSLPPGEYKIAAAAPGFANVLSERISLSVDQDVRVDFTLKPGSASQTITVTGGAPLVNTENGERGTTLSENQVLDLPSLGRDVLGSLPLLSPGVVLARQQFDNDPPLRFSVNGGRALTQDLVIDSAESLSVNINSWNMNNAPNQDAIQEMKFQTNAYAAENGRGTATINIVTKSGTNQFHGDLYDFIRNEAFNANDFFNKQNQLQHGLPNKVGRLRDNLYGGTLGGPILKNKLFFFMLYEREPNTNPNQAYSTVPTDAFKQGDFSALCQNGFDSSGVCNPAPAGSSLTAVQIYDPATTTPNPNYDSSQPASSTNTPYLRTPFPNNVIPSGRLDPVAVKAVSYFPEPNAGGAGALLNNEYVNDTSANTTWRINPRIDYNPSEKHLLFFKLGYTSNVSTPGGFWPGENPADNGRSNTSVPGWFAVLGDTYTFSDHLVSDFRLGFERDSTTTTYPATGKNYAGKLGLPNSNDENFPVFGFGAGNAGYGLGPGNALNQWEQTLQYAEAISYLKGKHAFKFGGDLRFNQVNKQDGRGDPSGTFGFSGGYTAPYFIPASQPLTASMADFLLGWVNHYAIDPASFVWGARKKEASWFAQDDWKLTPKLTLNLGLRQDIQMSWHEVQNRYAEFSPTTPNTFTPSWSTTPITLPGGLVYGVTQINGNKPWNFAPRVGFAWLPFANQRTVVRGGAGGFISPASTIEDYGDTGQGQETGYALHAAASTTSNLTPVFMLQNGGPAAVLPAKTPELANGGGALYIKHGEATPMVYSWSLTIARELPAHTVVEASYVGTRGNHLPFERTLNQVTAANVAIEKSLGVQNTGPYQPYSQIPGLSGRYHDANSTYNSVQLKLEQKLKKNLDWTFAYTLSKSMDNSSLDPTISWGGAAWNGSGVQDIYNLRANWARSAFDQRQAFSSSFIYELPIGHGQKFLNSGVLGRAVGGWQLNSVLQGRVGQPVEFSTANTSYSNNEIERPNCTGAAFKGHPKLAAGVGIVNWWNAGAFSAPDPYTFGNCGRDLGSVPGYQEVDLSVFKNTLFPTPLNENTVLQFRVEAYNALNRTNFGAPNNNWLPNNLNPNFGLINSDVNGPRTLTMALKLIF